MKIKKSRVKGYTNKKLIVCLFNLTFIIQHLLLCLLYSFCNFVCEKLSDFSYYLVTPIRRKMHEWAWYEDNKN